MGAVWIIRENATWFPRTSELDWVITRIAEQENPLLDKLVTYLKEQTQNSLIVIRLTETSDVEMNELYQAVVQIYFSRIAETLHFQFNTSEEVKYRAYELLVLGQLRVLLQTDPRVLTHKSGGNLLIHSSQTWTCPSWCYDFIIEFWAFRCMIHDRKLASKMLEWRASQGDRYGSLADFTTVEFNVLLESYKEVRSYYENGRAGTAWKSNGLHQIIAEIEILFQMLASDHRALNGNNINISP